jgi:hypothetical protein
MREFHRASVALFRVVLWGYTSFVDVQLTTDESAAVRKALRSYLRELRQEISDTDNAIYKRELREERASLESAVQKLDELSASGGPDDSASATSAQPVARVVQLWWTIET